MPYQVRSKMCGVYLGRAAKPVCYGKSGEPIYCRDWSEESQFMHKGRPFYKFETLHEALEFIDSVLGCSDSDRAEKYAKDDLDAEPYDDLASSSFTQFGHKDQ